MQTLRLFFFRFLAVVCTAVAAFVTAAEGATVGAVLSDGLTVPAGVSSPEWEDHGLANIALGHPCIWAPAMNFILGAGPNEQMSLTALWFTSGTRGTTEAKMGGWQDTGRVAITVDLGTVQAIGGVALRMAAGKGNVHWPKAIGVLVSDDGKAFFPIGDLVVLDQMHGTPPTGTFALHQYWTGALHTHGRWVMFVVAPDEYGVVADQVEVYRGDPESLNAPLAEPHFSNAREYGIAVDVSRRLGDDLQAVRNVTNRADLSAGQRGDLMTTLDAIAGKLPQEFHPQDSGFRAVLPLDALHERIFGAQAALWRALQQPPLTLMQANPWDPLPYLPERPLTTGAGPMTVVMMENEHRAMAFNLCNSGMDTVQVRLKITGLPGGDNPAWVSVSESVWTDTGAGEPVAAALLPTRREGVDYVVAVPPGLIRQVWLDFHPVTAQAGDFHGQIVSTGIGPGVSLPVNLKIYPMHFPDHPTLHLGGWDYTEEDIRGVVGPQNRGALITYLRDHGVDSPWATGAVWPANRDTARFDQWVTRWPSAGQYCIFASTGESFEGAARGTPEFYRQVGDWIRFWVAHAEGLGVRRDQLVVGLVDEPAGAKADATIVDWAWAIQSAATGVKIWEDPIHSEPSAANQEMMWLCDVLCPNRMMFLAGDQSFRNYYTQRERSGQELAFYSCSGPAHALDPYSYYRLQAWSCWQSGATSSYFWSLGGDSLSAWNEYPLPQTGSYLPFFMDEKSVTSGRQMEAVRESVEDYEYLRMLRDAIAGAAAKVKSHGVVPTTVSQAQLLLAGAADRVLQAQQAGEKRWDQPKDRSIADQVRAEILEQLVALEALGGKNEKTPATKGAAGE